MTEENGYRAARSLLEQADAPTAILCSSLIMALGVVRALARTRAVHAEGCVAGCP